MNSQALWARSSDPFFKSSSTGLKAVHGKANMLQEGSSPAPGVAQKLQAFRHRHTPWLLFGLCICLSAAAGSLAPRLLIGSPPALAQDVVHKAGLPTASSSHEEPQGKQVHLNYHVTGELMTQISWLGNF